MAEPNGMIIVSTRTYTVGLVVRDGVVVDAPPFARRWAMGRDARQLWRDGRRRNADLTWVPDD